MTRPSSPRSQPHVLHPHQVRYPRPTRLVRPASYEAACEALADPALAPARVIAGGTDLLLEIERGARPGLNTLVDLSLVEHHDRIILDGDIARLGAGVTHNQVIAHPELQNRALPLAQACLEVASPQLRNRATVVGNIVTASPANDTISALIALGATIEVRSTRGTRRLPIDDFLTGFRQSSLADDELVAAVEVQLLRPGRRGLFAKLGNRNAQAISVIHLSTVVDLDSDGIVRSARIVAGSVAATVVSLTDAAATLVGGPLDDAAVGTAAALAAASVTPIDDIRATADYRSQTLETLVRRSLHALARDAQADQWPTHVPLLVRPGRPPRSTAPVTRTIEVDTPVTITVNGELRTAPDATDRTLLDWIRAEAATGTKEGCAEGECGACTVDLDGRAVLACLTLAAQADGVSVTTVEGLGVRDEGRNDLDPLQQAFIDCSAAQCGFCTPGFLVSGHCLLDEIPVPDDDAIKRGLAGNLCRCTGYVSIMAAVRRAAAAPVAEQGTEVGP